MFNRVKTLEVTKAYGEAFNNADVAAIADMIDDQNVIFTRQEQNTIVGKDNVVRRIRTLFHRTAERNRTLKVVNAIIDLGQSKARPCLLCLMNGVPVAVCVISCKANGKINAISILLSGGVVASARPTDKRALQDKNESAEPKRADVIALTKTYIEAFNKRDLSSLGELLDVSKSVFTRTDQPAVVGREAIIARVRDLYRRLDTYGQELKVVNAIIDHNGKTAWPCSLGVLDGVPMSVGLLTLTPEKCISNIDIILTAATVAKARPSEPLPEPKKADPTLEKLEEREAWLHERAKKIAKAKKRDGNLPHLITKEMQVERQLEKIAYLKRKMRS